MQAQAQLAGNPPSGNNNQDKIQAALRQAYDQGFNMGNQSGYTEGYEHGYGSAENRAKVLKRWAKNTFDIGFFIGMIAMCVWMVASLAMTIEHGRIQNKLLDSGIYLSEIESGQYVYKRDLNTITIERKK